MGEVIVVSGGSAGIGWATCAALAAQGATVIGASRRATAGPGWQAVAMDVTDERSVHAAMGEVLERHGRIDAVVACAGDGIAGPAETTETADARAQLDTNFWGAVHLVQAALPTMRAQGRGRIVLISSIGGVIGLPFQSYYSASKFALEGWGEALAWEVAPFGIDVTLVQPGNVATDFTDRRRVVGLEGAAAAYRGAADRAIATMAADERNGVDATTAASAIASVLGAAHPPRRRSVGKPDERVGLLAKRLLPARLFEAAARSSLGV
jgi:NAD(P)-dependent dehydrogenase (short-subunit alcohol dehydrogenase family)